MKERQSDFRILEMLTEMKETQVEHTVELKNFNKTLSKVDSSLFGNGTNKEGMITKQAKFRQHLNILTTAIVFVTTTVVTLLIKDIMT